MIDEAIATKVMGWIRETLPNNEEGLPYTADYWTENGEKQVPTNFFNPSTNLEDAWKVAEKLGLALIPQSNDDGSFSWFACDIEKVSYRGEEIAITPIDGTEYSQPTAQLAICASALMTVGIDIEDVI